MVDQLVKLEQLLKSHQEEDQLLRSLQEKAVGHVEESLRLRDTCIGWLSRCDQVLKAGVLSPSAAGEISRMRDILKEELGNVERFLRVALLYLHCFAPLTGKDWNGLHLVPVGELN
jgi:hypothetical protein